MKANRPQGPPPGGLPEGPPGGAPPDLSQIFSAVDADEDGSLSETEAQSLADFINGATGQELDAQALLETKA